MKEKFTAVLTHETDKARVVEIREASGLSEKDVMTAILDAAMPFRDAIISAAKTLTEGKAAAKETMRKQKYEEMKAAMKIARKAVKEAGIAPSATEPQKLSEVETIKPKKGKGAQPPTDAPQA